MEQQAADMAACFERAALEVAHQPSVALHSVREHVRHALPTVVQTKQELEAAAQEAHEVASVSGATTEFAHTLSSSLGPAAARMQQQLTEALSAASAIQRQRAEAAPGYAARLRSLFGGSSSTSTASRSVQ